MKAFDNLMPKGTRTTLPAAIVDETQTVDVADILEYIVIMLRRSSSGGGVILQTSESKLAIAHKLYQHRRTIDKVFNSEGFATSPAFDILLDLYMARVREKRVSVTSATIGAACPPTTALRWIQVLEDLDLLCRHEDESDKRRIFVDLTRDGLKKVEQVMELFQG